MSLLGYLAERERIEQGATRGPWESGPNDESNPYGFGAWLHAFEADGERFPLVIAPPAQLRDPADGIFIADARTAVPTLIAMVREARETLTTIAEDDDGESWSAGCAQRALARLDAMATEDAT